MCLQEPQHQICGCVTVGTALKLGMKCIRGAKSKRLWRPHPRTICWSKACFYLFPLSLPIFYLQLLDTLSNFFIREIPNFSTYHIDESHFNTVMTLSIPAIFRPDHRLFIWLYIRLYRAIWWIWKVALTLVENSFSYFLLTTGLLPLRLHKSRSSRWHLQINGPGNCCIFIRAWD